jgi:hypothetical protein
MHMHHELRRWAVLLAGLAGLATQAAAQTTTIDLDAQTPAGVTLQLDAGSYNVAFIGKAQGSAYDGWNPWGAGVVNSCDVNGQNCARGYTEAYAITIAGTSTQYVTASPYYASAIDALAGHQAGPLVQSINGAPVIPADMPMAFTLLAPTPVQFSVLDSLYGDNAGGVSLSVTAVPEPSGAGLLAGGLIGLALWRRRVAVAR